MDSSRHCELLDSVAAHYENRLAAHGPSAAGVDWKSEESQQLRHLQFVRLLPQLEHDVSVIDLGCGYGDFLSFLRMRRSRARYIGYDVVAGMINVARQIYGEDDDRRWKRGWVPDESADFVVASGIFNVKGIIPSDRWEAYVLDVISSMANFARSAVAFNMLTAHCDAPFMRDDLYYADPANMLDRVVKSIGRRVAIVQDYGLFEFTIAVWKSETSGGN